MELFILLLLQLTDSKFLNMYENLMDSHVFKHLVTSESVNR